MNEAALLGSMPFAVATGVLLDSASKAEVRGRLPWAENRCTAGGLLHGGALMTLADSVGAVCAFLNLPEGASTSTVSSSTSLVRGVRAGLVYNTVMSRLAREHNDARIVALGGRMQSLSDALAMVKVFLDTPFSNDPRHVRRIQLLDAYEAQHAR